MKEFITAIEADEAEQAEEEQYTEFKLDGQVLRAYYPTGGQLTFMIAAMGRGQSNTQRFAAIINVMLSCLRDDDKDYLENRLLDRKNRLDPERIEEIFAYLTEEWFGRPTQQSSDSTTSPPNDGLK